MSAGDWVLLVTTTPLTGILGRNFALIPMSSRSDFLEAMAADQRPERVKVWPMPAWLLNVVGEGENAYVRRDLIAYATSEGRKLYPDFYCRQFGITIDILKGELMELAKRGLLTINDGKTAKGHLWLEVIGTPDLQSALYDARQEARSKWSDKSS